MFYIGNQTANEICRNITPYEHKTSIMGLESAESESQEKKNRALFGIYIINLIFRLDTYTQ